MTIQEAIVVEWAAIQRELEVCEDGMADNPDDAEWPTLHTAAEEKADMLRRLAAAAGVGLAP